MKMLDRYLDKYFARKAVELARDTLWVLAVTREIVKTDISYELYISGRGPEDKYRGRIYSSKFGNGLDDYYFLLQNREELVDKANKLIQELREQASPHDKKCSPETVCYGYAEFISDKNAKPYIKGKRITKGKRQNV